MYPYPSFFASESVTGSFLQLYHYLVYKVCISALRQQLIAVRKQGVKNIPSFFCRQIKVVFLLSHTKITSALTVSITANGGRSFSAPTPFDCRFSSVSVMPSRSARCFIRRSNSSAPVPQHRQGRNAACRLSKGWYKAPFLLTDIPQMPLPPIRRCAVLLFRLVVPSRGYNNRPIAHTKDRFARCRCTVSFCNPPKLYIRTYITVSRLPHSVISCYEIFLPLYLPL